MATQTVTPVENVPDNEVERLIQAVFGRHWIKNCMGKLTPEQLKGAASLADSNVEATILQIAALGHALANIHKDELEESRVNAIGWTIKHLAEYADMCRLIVVFANELQDPEAREWQISGKLDAAA